MLLLILYLMETVSSYDYFLIRCHKHFYCYVMLIVIFFFICISYVLSFLIPSLHTHRYHLSTFIIGRQIFTSQWYVFVLNSKRLHAFAHLEFATIDITIMNIQPFTTRKLLVVTDYYCSSSICLFVSYHC